MRVLTLLPVFLLAFSGCKRTEHDHHQHDAKTPVLQAGSQTFGSAITLGQTTTLADILKTPENFQDKEVLTEGVVKAACKKMGCWMELATSMEAEAGCRVTFKDYGFFVPKDSQGRIAKVQAKVDVKKINRSEVRHMEAEGAKFKEKTESGSAYEVRLVATGVDMREAS